MMCQAPGTLSATPLASAVYIYDGDGRRVKSILNQRVPCYPLPLYQLLVDGSSQQVS